jgi:hypothetical protein
VNPFSIFFLMHALVVLLAGASAGALAGMITHHFGGPGLAVGLFVGFADMAVLQASYFLTILKATSEPKLQDAKS